jgi:CHAD domain-containing protein
MGTVTFTFADEERAITEEDARWLLGQVRTAAVLTEAASSAVAKLSEAISEGRGVETTLAERRELIDALERGGSKPRSAELRRLEIELRAAVYAETYFKDE